MEKRVASRGETSNRSDDNPETMKKRIETFVKVTTPLCNWLQTQGNLVKISALNSKENVFEDVKKVFDQHFQ